MKKPNYVVPFVFVLLILYVIIAISVQANTQSALKIKQKSEKELITQLDLDKDGQISIKEAVAAPAVLAEFGKIDTNRNGMISPMELRRINLIVEKLD